MNDDPRPRPDLGPLLRSLSMDHYERPKHDTGGGDYQVHSRARNSRPSSERPSKEAVEAPNNYEASVGSV